jgi:hypothetical protein
MRIVASLSYRCFRDFIDWFSASQALNLVVLKIRDSKLYISFSIGL